MLDIIHLLPDSVANQIAAGEVIQRPASVVKELVENSIDAGATSIKIIIKDAGRTLIQVVDNGCGMSVTDARMAFERHATSKIHMATDLFSLRTMGFRGEALPSIAAVSEIEMRTMRQEDATGTRIIISASKVESQQPDMCSAGTNIMVKRLFFNLPARRKFLKKDPIENGHITREFERLALVNTNIEFSLNLNDAAMRTLAPAPLKQRIGDLFGKSLEHQLIPVETDTSLVKITGFVGLPENARRRNALQYFFVNGRYMRHPYFHKAVLGCYENLIQSDQQPNYFINLEVDPETIDVNIHPQKYEIKFENEQPIWQILSAAIKESLGRFNASAAIDFDSVDSPDIPAFDSREGSRRAPDPGYDPSYNPFDTYKKPNSAPRNWQKLYEDFSHDTAQSFISQEVAPPPMTDEPAPSLMQAEPEVLPMFQLKGRYIVSPSKSGLMLIDQHRAHVRILFEKYSESAETGTIPSQRLIFPDSVNLDPSQDMTVASISELLNTMGFEVTNLGNCSWAINAVPAMLEKASPAEALLNIINAINECDDDVERSQWEKVALSMAKSAAIKYGAPLTVVEMDRIVSDLFRLGSPDYTPDGKTIIRLLDLDTIQKMF